MLAGPDLSAGSRPRTAFSPAPRPGLVTCAISEEASRALLRFPTSEMLSAAAALYPEPERGGLRAGLFPVPRRRGEWRFFRQSAEGPHGRVEIGPGIVRVRRVDTARKERAEERARAAFDFPKAAEAAWWREGTKAGVDAALGIDQGAPRRGVVRGWSAKSRARLISTICELDLAAFVGSGTPCMVTLTMPGDWLAVAPDAAAAAAAFHRFGVAWRDHFAEMLRCIWKREFQRRGAPHWHLWLVPPAGVALPDFVRWVSEGWTASLFGKAATATAVEHAAAGRCSCCEACRSLSAGAGVDFAEGLRASDPKRLAIYFLKESLGGEGKAYQNLPPKEWAGQSVGRYWGYKGLTKAVETVEVSPSDTVRAARILRRWQHAKGITRQRTVPRFDWETGVVTYRKVRRRARVIGAAGWVATNSGAVLGADIGRFLSMSG